MNKCIKKQIFWCWLWNAYRLDTAYLNGWMGIDISYLSDIQHFKMFIFRANIQYRMLLLKCFWGKLTWIIVIYKKKKWHAKSTLVIRKNISFSASFCLFRRCFTKLKNSYPKQQVVRWTRWTHQTPSGAGFTWRNVASGTCFRYLLPLHIVEWI